MRGTKIWNKFLTKEVKEIQAHSKFLTKIKTKLLESDNERKYCKSLLQLEVEHRGGSRTAVTSAVELFVAMVNSFYQWNIVMKISILDVETVPPGTHRACTHNFLQALFPK